MILVVKASSTDFLNMFDPSVFIKIIAVHQTLVLKIKYKSLSTVLLNKNN